MFGWTELHILKKVRLFSSEILTKYSLINIKHFVIPYLGQKTRTITNQLILIRTLFNLAIKKELLIKNIIPSPEKRKKLELVLVIK